MLKCIKITLGMLPLIMLGVVSCNKTKTYAAYLKEERKKISDYIDYNQIDVWNTKPDATLNEWKNEKGNDIYFRTSSGLYYHQIDSGTGELANDYKGAYVRYRGTDLSGILIYDCTGNSSPNPQFVNLISGTSNRIFGSGFQEAVKKMREGGHCKIIIPFAIGNGPNLPIGSTTPLSDSESYTPMLYEIWLIKVE